MAAEPTTVEDQATVRGVSVEDGKSLDRQAARQGSISLETRRTDVAGSSSDVCGGAGLHFSESPADADARESLFHLGFHSLG